MMIETVCCLYHPKKDFISVPYKPNFDDVGEYGFRCYE